VEPTESVDLEEPVVDVAVVEVEVRDAGFAA
jgi:hypothetical protein